MTPPHLQPIPHILLLGSGVTGLQTALSLLQTNHYTITIIASDLPPTATSASPSPVGTAEYTSPHAGAIWRSHVPPSSAPDYEVRDWDVKTYNVWLGLLGTERDARVRDAVNTGSSGATKKGETGLSMQEMRMLWSTKTPETEPDGKGIWWRGAVKNFTLLHPDELKKLELRGSDPKAKVPALFGTRFDTVVADVPIYLAYLLRQVKKLGGEVIQARVETGCGIQGVVKGMRDVFLASRADGRASVKLRGLQWKDVHAVILAPGLAARDFLPPSEAKKLFPIRSQTVMVKGLAKCVTTHIFSSSGNAKLEDETTYIVPRPHSGVTLIGGSKQVGDYNTNIDDGLTKRILERAKSLVKELLTGPDGGFEVLHVRAGLRPAREGGPRVEMEREGLVEGVRVIYSYGHGGSGYENSLGSAEKVVKILGGEGRAKL